MPTSRVQGFSRMLPVLEAREQLRDLNTLLIGSGRVEGRTARDATDKLQLVANHGTTPQRQVQRFQTAEAAMAYMASMGVGVPS